MRSALPRRIVAIVSDHPVVSVFVVALLVRLVVGIVLSAGGWIYQASPDTTLYVRAAEKMAGGRTCACGAYEDIFATYLLPVSVLFRFFGPYVILAQLVAATYGAIAAAAVARLAREFVSLPWALAAGAVVALFPSQVLWSSLPLRDSAIWATTACLALSVTLLLRTRSTKQLVALSVAIAALLYLIGHLRAYSTVVSALGLVVVAVVVRAARAPVVVGLVLVAIGLLVPMTSPLVSGFGGIDLANNDLGAIRSGNAANAESAFITTDDLGQSDISHLPEGLKVVLAEPLPWTHLQGSSVKVTRLESPLWWALVLSAFTAVAVLWRARRVLGFPALYAAGVIGVLALAEGNFGTLARHRNELVWPAALLAVGGLSAWRAKRKRKEAPVEAALSTNDA